MSTSVVTSWWGRLGFAGQFHIISLAILMAGALLIGSWLSQQIKSSVMERSGHLSGLFVESVLAAQLRDVMRSGTISESAREDLERIFRRGALGREVVEVKIWMPDGRIVYSAINPSLIGQQFAPNANLLGALSGQVYTGISDLSSPDNVRERDKWRDLKEIYIPMQVDADSDPYAVVELYVIPDALRSIISSSQKSGWMLVSTAAGLFYLLLIGIVRQVNRLVHRQRDELADRVEQLGRLLDQNEQMRDRIRSAGGQVTALNEQYLHRASAELHDGPAQDLAVALLRLDELAGPCGECPHVPDAERRQGADVLKTIRTAVKSALEGVRGWCLGLRLSDVEQLTIPETADRAISAYEAKTGQSVERSIEAHGAVAPIAIKITLYRLIQEGLVNGFRHARGARQRVDLSLLGGDLLVEVADDGAGLPGGLDLTGGQKLGINGMRERVYILGGSFDISSPPGGGTVVRARLPLQLPETTVA